MFKTITIINYKEEKFVIDIFNPQTSGYNIRNIEGLGPVKADVNTTPIVTKDGDVFNSARANKRNIVFTLGFEIATHLGLSSIESVRQRSYKIFPLKSKVKINIKTDNRDLYTYGYVESNEPNIFSEDETAQISVICPDSYFTSEKERDVKLDQIRSEFKFPFEVLEEDLEKINIAIPGHDESIQIIRESTDILDDYIHNGNVSYGLIDYFNLYMDMQNLTYEGLESFTYEELKMMQEV